MPSKKQYMERRENISSILAYIRANGPKSRRQLSNELNLSWGCVSELITILLSQNILLEDLLSNEKSRGRTTSVLSLNPNIYFLGVDINKMGLKACICNLQGEKTEDFGGELRQTSKSDFINSVSCFVNSILKNRANICGVGFAMQGIYSKNKTAWEFPAKTSILIDFEEDFKGLIKLPVVVAHDPDCILYGCFEGNEGSKMIVRMDSGIGVSVYKNNAFLKDELLEIGYFAVNEQGDRLDKIISKSAFIKALQDGNLDEYLNYAGKILGIVLGNICNFLSLDEVYLCGDIINNYNLLNSAFYEHYKKTVLPTYAAEIISVPVVNASYGAAKLAIDNFKGE